MSQLFLHLTPLKEENNSDEEDEDNEKSQNPPLSSERLKKQVSLKSDETKLNPFMNENNLNNIREKYKSPKKSVNKTKVFSELIVLNKANPSKVDLCIRALSFPPNKRNQEMLNHIKSYLKSMPSFMNIISKEKNAGIGENLIDQISIHLRHEYMPKNNLVCRFGEKGDKFYIILKGKISFLIPKLIKCYLNLEEYIVYLMQLRNNEEYELLNNLLVQNRISYPIEDDNLDDYLIKEYDEYQKHLMKVRRKKIKSKTGKFVTFKNSLPVRHLNFVPDNINVNQNNIDYDLKSNLKLNLKEGERLKTRLVTMRVNNDLNNNNNPNNSKKGNFFSYQTYKKMGLLVDKIRENKSQNFSLSEAFSNPLTGANSVRLYLKSNNVQDLDLEPLGRKLVSVYNYEVMNTFENGQTFGFIALQTKVSKRMSTTISVEDTDLGVLTKEEYIQFFEILSSKEKKNLYELLRYYSLLTTVSEYKFIKRYYHMFEYKKFYKNINILEIGKPFKELIVFSLGLFVIHISVNYPELNDLITNIKKIRGKLQGLSKYKIEKTLDEQRENQDLIIRRNYMSEKDNKILLKKYNYTISIISDHLILGYPDTVDPETHLPLFNCVCTSAESDGYSITNKSINLVNQETTVIQNLNDFCLMKIEYNLKRLKQFKKEIWTKIQEEQISSFKESKEVTEDIFNLNNNINTLENNKKESIDIQENNFFPDKNNYINRNELNQPKNVDNNKKKLLTNILNQDQIDKAINIINWSKNEEMKNTTERFKFNNNYSTRNNKISNLKQFNSDSNQNDIKENSSTISKLRQSIINKQKRIELKIEKNNNELNNQKNKEKNGKNSIIRSLSSTSINGNTDDNINNNTIKNNSLRKSINQRKLNNLNMFRSYIKEIDKIKSYNSQMLTPFLTKNRVKTLPSIKNKDKNLKNLINDNNLKTESEPQKKIEKYIDQDLYKIAQLSFVKEKFIVFLSKKGPKKDNFNNVKNDFLPRLKKNKRNQPMKLQKNFFSRLSINYLDNNSKDIRDNEDKKNNYTTTLYQKLNSEKISKEKIIKDKYNELNNLVNNMQNITKEILSKRK